jgi:hypothetical protein
VADIFINDGTRLLATARDGRLYVTPGVSRESIAFLLFQTMLQAMTPDVGMSVTWGTNYTPIAANQGDA